MVIAQAHKTNATPEFRLTPDASDKRREEGRELKMWEKPQRRQAITAPQITAIFCCLLRTMQVNVYLSQLCWGWMRNFTCMLSLSAKVNWVHTYWIMSPHVPVPAGSMGPLPSHCCLGRLQCLSPWQFAVYLFLLRPLPAIFCAG